MSDTSTVTYARYLLPEVIVPEETVIQVRSRDPQEAIRKAPDHAYAFRFFDRSRLFVNGEELSGKPGSESGWFYIGGERLTETDLEAMGPRYETLLDNMRGNRWPAVVRCRHGNFQPLHDGDQIVKAA